MRKRSTAIIVIICVAVIGALAWFFLGPASDPGDDGLDGHYEGDTAALSGRIFDSSGRPLGGAHVFAGAAGARADARGYFSFSDLPAGQIPVDATAEGYRRAGFDDLGRPIVDLRDGEPVEGLELFLPRAAAVSGQVVAGGEPVENAEISLSYLYAEGLDGDELEPFIVSEIARSGPGGEFEIEEMAPGRLQFLVDVDGHEFTESLEIYFRPGQHRSDVIIDLAPTGTLRGVVVDEEGNPHRARILVESQRRRDANYRTTSDDDGQFILRQLDTGNYMVRAEADDLMPATERNVIIRPDRVTETELVLGKSRGIFGYVQSTEGNPVYGARIQLEQGDQSRRLSTDHNGYFEWPDAPPGPWTAVATSPSHDTSQTYTLRRDEEALLELTPGGSVAGHVVDSNGDPVRHFHVGVAHVDLNDDRDTPFHTSRRAAEDFYSETGRFELGPLQTGLYQFVVTSDGYPPALTEAVRVRPGVVSGPIRIELERGATISGTVTDSETGEPIAGAQVTLAIATSNNRPPSTQTDAQGRYELSPLPSGRSSLRVSHEQYVYELFSGISVPQAGQVDYDVSLEPIGDGQPGQNMQGIGASLRPGDGGFEVVSTHSNSPAAAAGIREGDVIHTVDGTSVDGMTIRQVVELIRGEPGTTVTLGVHRSGRGTRTIRVNRERIFLPQQRQVRTAN